MNYVVLQMSSYKAEKHETRSYNPFMCKSVKVVEIKILHDKSCSVSMYFVLKKPWLADLCWVYDLKALQYSQTADSSDK